MNFKTISLYLFQTLIGFLGHGLGLIVYPIAFLFRHKVLAWANDKLYEDEVNHVYILKCKKRELIHPWFVLFWFFTGLDSEHLGPEWYKKELKEKWFGDASIIEALTNKHPWINSEGEILENVGIILTFKSKLRYFYLCYCWEAFRNGFYNWNMLLRGGKYKEGTVKVIYEKHK